MTYLFASEKSYVIGFSVFFLLLITALILNEYCDIPSIVRFPLGYLLIIIVKPSVQLYRCIQFVVYNCSGQKIELFSEICSLIIICLFYISIAVSFCVKKGRERKKRFNKSDENSF